MKADDYQLIVNAQGAITDLKGTSNPQKPTFAFNLTPQVVVRSNTQGYVIKVFIPTNKLGINKLTSLSAIGLGLARNIDTNLNPQRALWNSQAKSFQNASNWTPVNLVSSEPLSTACATKFQGDANCDGNITLTDFKIWFIEYNKQCSTTNPANCLRDIDQDSNPMDADFNGDSKITLRDFLVWYRSYQQTR